MAIDAWSSRPHTDLVLSWNENVDTRWGQVVPVVPLEATAESA